MNHANVAREIRNSESLNALAIAGDFVAIQNALNGEKIKQTTTKLWQAKEVLGHFDLEIGSVIVYGFEQAALQTEGPFGTVLRTIWSTLTGDGLNFSNAKVQAQLDVLVAKGIWGEQSATIGKLLKELGIADVSVAQSKFGADITSEDVESIAIEYNKIKLTELINTRVRNLFSAVELGEVKTEQEAIAKFGE